MKTIIILMVFVFILFNFFGCSSSVKNKKQTKSKSSRTSIKKDKNKKESNSDKNKTDQNKSNEKTENSKTADNEKSSQSKNTSDSNQPPKPDVTQGADKPAGGWKTVKISGRVIDVKTNQPITGAVVKVGDSSVETITNQNGEYALEVSPAEAVVVSANADKYISGLAAGSIKPDKPKQVDFKLQLEADKNSSPPSPFMF